MIVIPVHDHSRIAHYRASIKGFNEMVRRRVDYNSAVHTRRIIVMHIACIGIDLGKTTFHLVALGERSKVLVREKFSRTQLLAYTANLPSSLIGLEACSGAHFLGTALRKQGHEVRLIPAQFVKPNTFTRTALRPTSNLLQFGDGPYIKCNDSINNVGSQVVVAGKLEQAQAIVLDVSQQRMRSLPAGRIVCSLCLRSVRGE
jgi:hypothetical protein